MDKVDFSQGVDNSLTSGIFGSHVLGGNEARKAGKKNNVRDPWKKGFSGALDRSILELGEIGPPIHIAPSEEAVQQLLDAVQSTGNDLKHRPFPEEILEYKKAVRDFINYIVENTYELEQTQTAYRKRKELKPYLQIRIIDQKLEELAAGILTRQINQLDLSSKLEEIKGLLVDLTVTGKIS